MEQELTISGMEAQTNESLEFDQAKVESFYAELEMQQNLLFALVGGLLAAVVGGAVWAGITVLTRYQIGWMAVGVGFIVGFTVRICGKGLSDIYGIAGAAFALLGCLFGNVLSTCGFLSIEQSAPFFQVVTSVLFHPAVIVEFLKITFSPMDLLFYGIAVYEGFKFSFREIAHEEMAALLKTRAIA